MHTPTRSRGLLFAAAIPLFLVASVSSIAPACAADPKAPAKAPAPRAWEHATSDLAPDPRFRFGALDNGMRFVWTKNGTPKDRTVLRLHVRVGSLGETDQELGMAHFLEHMAFNGSKHYAAGSLVSWFQGLGMEFGSDTNAHTGFDETVYEIDLPRSDAASIGEGLKVLRDFADGLVLAKEEIDAEKGVIDGEERERESAAARAERSMFTKLFAGTRYPDRIPIGTKEKRDAFDPALVRGFYERWYRPENFTLVLVGDVGELDVEAAIHTAFDGVAVPEAPLPDDAAVGAPTFAHTSFAVSERELPVTRVMLASLRPYRADPFDSKHLLADFPLSVARALLDRRLLELSRTGTAPFQHANAARFDGLRGIDGESLDVVCEAARWKDAISLAEQELRRATEFGFSESELAVVKAQFREAFERDVADAPTADSADLAEDLLTAAFERYVPTSPAAMRDLLVPALEKLDAAGVSAAFAAAWKDGTRVVHAIGPLDLGNSGDDGATALTTALEESAKVKVEKKKDAATTQWKYAADGERAGKVGKREKDSAHGVEDVTFENGVRLLLKPTDFEKDRVTVEVSVGEGALTLGRERYALGFVANAVFTPGGLVAHDVEEIDRLLAGRSVECGFAVEDDRCKLIGATARADLSLELELLAAHVTAPGWRDSGFAAFVRQKDEMFTALEHRPDGPLLQRVIPGWFGGDQRFGIPTQESVSKFTLDDVRAWLTPELEHAPITVAIVGDFDVEGAVASAAATFGALPARRPARHLDDARKASEMAAGQTVEQTFDAAGLPALVFVAFPTTDGIDPHTRRALSFLGRVLNDRIRVKVREELGATYAPSAVAQSSTVYPQVGSIAIQAAAAPDQAVVVRDACIGVAADMAEHGVTDEEVERLRGPLLAKLRDDRRQNSFWVKTLSDLHSSPTALGEVDSAEAMYSALDAKELSALAARYLAKDRASSAILKPSGAGG